MDLNKLYNAREVLTLALEQQVSEIATCNTGHGVGRASNHAPLFVHISTALERLEQLINTEKMAAVRAGKKTSETKE